MNKGCQTPTFKLVSNYNKSYGNVCCSLMEGYGHPPFTGQKNYSLDFYAIDDNGKGIHSTAVLIVPRQNGKTELISGFITTALTTKQGELNSYKVLYSAHRTKTSRETFEGLASTFNNDVQYPELKELAKCGKGIRRGKGDESISTEWVENGQVINATCEFMARDKSGGRGFSANMVIFDEAQELTYQQQAAILPTLAAAKEKPLIIYIGTPIYPNCQGDVLVNLRKTAHEKKPDKMLYYEWATEEIGDVGDKKRWYRQNPSAGVLISEDAIYTECMNMDKLSFARERLGYGPPLTETIDHPIKLAEGSLTKCEEIEISGSCLYYLSVKFDISSNNAAITVCVYNEKTKEYGVELIKIVKCRGLYQLANIIHKIYKKGKVKKIIIDSKNKATDLCDRLDNLGIKNKSSKKKVIIAKYSDIASSCSMFCDAIKGKEVMHYEQQITHDAATNCVRREIGKEGNGGYSDYQKGKAYIIEGLSMAYYIARTSKKPKKVKARISSGW